MQKVACFKADITVRPLGVTYRPMAQQRKYRRPGEHQTLDTPRRFKGSPPGAKERSTHFIVRQGRVTAAGIVRLISVDVSELDVSAHAANAVVDG